MKLFNWENLKKTSNAAIDKENKPINEALDRNNFQSKDLQTENFQPEVFEEEARLTENDPEKNFIPIEAIPDDFDLETYILNIIDQQHKPIDDAEVNEVKAPATTHLPNEVKEIIQKYSLPNDEWKKLNYQERKTRLENIQASIVELYIKKPKKMMPKKNKNESIEKAA
jgi:hypothetical protein